MKLKCTKKLLDKLKIKNFENITTIGLNEDIENWHCNIIDYGEVYAILMTNDKTLYSFFIFGISDDDLKNLDDFKEIIKQNVFKTMFGLGFTQEQTEKILDSLEDIQFSKTDNRGVVSSMTQMMHYVHSYMEDERDLLDINRSLNTVIHTKLELNIPNREFERLLNFF